MRDSGGLARRETGRFPDGPLLQEVFRVPSRTREFISLIISWHSRQTGSAFSARVTTCMPCESEWAERRWCILFIHLPATAYQNQNYFWWEQKAILPFYDHNWHFINESRLYVKSLCRRVIESLFRFLTMRKC